MGRRRILCPVLLQGAFAMFWNVWHLGANPLHSFPQLLVPKFSVFGPRWPGVWPPLSNILAPFFSLQLINLSIYLSIYLSVYLSIHPSTVSIYLSIHRSIYPSIYPSIHLYDFFGSPRYRQQDIARHHFGCFIQLFHGRRDLGVEGGVDFHLRLRNISEKVKKGYGSIPIHTIFRGMKIHLPAILIVEQKKGIGFWSTPHIRLDHELRG